MEPYANLSKEELTHLLKQSAETLLQNDGGDERTRLIYELQLHQIELELQNHDLRQSQQALETSQGRYADLYDFAPVGYLTLDRKGVIHNLNLTVARLLGRERALLLNRPLAPLLAPATSASLFQHLRQVFGGEAPAIGVIELQSIPNGPVRSFRLDSRLYPHGNDAPRCLTTLIDITEQCRMERQLQQRHAELTSLLAAAPVGIALVRQGVLQWLSPHFLELLGSGETELLGQGVRALYPDDAEYARVERAQDAQLQASGISELEAQLQHQDGQRIPVLLRAAALDPKAKALGLILTVLDISERKRGEAQLALFRTLIDQCADAIYVIDPESSRILDTNGTGFLRLGYTRDELLLLGMTDLEQGFLNALAWQAYVQQVKESGRLSREGVYRCKDGTSFPVEINVQYIAQPQQDYMLAIARDTSERKLAEQALQESEIRSRLAVTAAQVALWDWNLVTDVTLWNENLAKIFGHSMTRITDAKHWWVEQVHSADRDRIAGAIARHIEHSSRIPWSEEYRFRRGDGQWATVIEWGQSLLDQAGRPYRMMGALLDVTTRRQSETERQRRRAITDCVHAIQAAYIGQLLPGPAFDHALLGVLKLTHSTYGFFFELMQDEEGKLYLQALSISNVAWDEASRRFYEDKAPGGLRFYRFDCLYGAAVAGKAIVVANDPANDPRSCHDMAKEHPPINTFLGVPLWLGDEVVGTVGLANRPEGYREQDAKELESVWDACARIIGSYRAQRAQAQAKDILRKSEERVRAIADYTYDWESWFGPDGRLMWVNPAVERLTGYAIAACKRMPDYPLPIVHETDRAAFKERLHQAIVKPAAMKDYDFRIARKDGQTRWMAISWQPIYTKQGDYMGLRTSVHDITNRKQAEAALGRLANHDRLTGLLNRQALEAILAAELERAKQLAQPFSLLMVDADHFKQINDTSGHQAGDAALRELGKLLAETGRRHDMAGRYGGEEFIVPLPECSTASACRYAERLLATVRSAVISLADGKSIRLTVSIGIATFPEHGESMERLIAAADKALYEAKATGRNRYCIAQPTRQDETPLSHDP